MVRSTSSVPLNPGEAHTRISVAFAGEASGTTVVFPLNPTPVAGYIPSVVVGVGVGVGVGVAVGVGFGVGLGVGVGVAVGVGLGVGVGVGVGLGVGVGVGVSVGSGVGVGVGVEVGAGDGVELGVGVTNGVGVGVPPGGTQLPEPFISYSVGIDPLKFLTTTWPDAGTFGKTVELAGSPKRSGDIIPATIGLSGSAI